MYCRDVKVWCSYNIIQLLHFVECDIIQLLHFIECNMMCYGALKSNIHQGRGQYCFSVRIHDTIGNQHIFQNQQTMNMSMMSVPSAPVIYNYGTLTFIIALRWVRYYTIIALHWVQYDVLWSTEKQYSPRPRSILLFSAP
jgi:hypothetical protein